MNYYVKRVGQALVIFIIVVTITFTLYRFMPGGPIEHMRNQLIRQTATAGEPVDMNRINKLVEIYTGLDPNKPWYFQYYEYIRDIILYQDFGKSIYHAEPVFQILFKAMPWSVFVSVYGLALGFSTNVVLGAYMAYKEGSLFDSSATVSVLVLSSVPYYVVAIFALAIFAFHFNVFPTGGRFDPQLDPGFTVEFMVSVVRHAALPILTGFVVGFGSGSLAMRGNSIRVMGEDYLRIARLRGIGETRLAVKYVARNAILPMYTSLMIGIAGIFSSGVIMEKIFTYPGVGWYTFGALMNRDYPLLMGAFIFYTGITLAGIVIADFTYGLIDPRISSGEEHESF